MSGQHTRFNFTYRTDKQGTTLEPTLGTAPLTMDRRVPFEVWQKICSYLYPSQLSRISMVSTALQDIVASLPYWSHLFRKVFKSKRTLCLLPLVPESRSYMLYMCAFSSMVCERCYSYFDRNTVATTAASLPLPVQVETHCQRQMGTVRVGLPVDPNWTIQLCLQCRKHHFSSNNESTPYATQNCYISRDLALEKYALNPDNHSAFLYGYRTRQGGIKEFLEIKVVEMARSEFGGDVGIRSAVAGSLVERLKRNDQRIMEYSHRGHREQDQCRQKKTL